MKYLKKEFLIIAIFVLMIIIFPIICTAQTTGTVNTETVRLRSEPSTDSKIVTLLSLNDNVSIVEKDGDWYKVTYGEYTGYISSEFIKTDEDVQDNKEEEKIEAEAQEEKVSEAIEPKTVSKQINVEKQIKDNTKLFYMPLIHSNIINTLGSQEVYVIQYAGNWAYVKAGKEFGWVRIEKLVEENVQENIEEKVEQEKEEEENQEEQANKQEETATVEETKKILYINAENVNFRKSADKSSEILDTLRINTEVEVIGEENGWYNVKVNDTVGYISASLLSTEKTVSSRSSEEQRTIEQQETVEVSSGDADIQNQIVEYAKTFLGCPYVYGGTSPNGFDCSGFVQYVYKHFGYSISRSSKTQVNDGVGIYDVNDLEPADILIFKSYSDGSTIGHVGLYIGNNQFIHANDENTGVIITSLSYGRYPERLVCGRRIV